MRNVANAMIAFFSPASLQYQVIYFMLVVAFTYFYTMVVFGQQNIAENLQKQGGGIPGIRPGSAPKVPQRCAEPITFLGAIFLGVVAVMPYFAQIVTGVSVRASPARRS